jgi:hypothetical protein
MTSTTGYNHLFWHEFRSLPTRQFWHKNTFGDSVCAKGQRQASCTSLENIYCLIAQTGVPFRPIRRALLPYLAVDVLAEGTQDVRP